VLPGTANIITAANDALIAIPISGGWQVVAYTRASGIAATAGPLASSGITGAAASGAITASGLTQATNRLLGRTTASTGAVEEITAGSTLSFSAGVLDVARPLTLGTAVNTTSGTSIDLTSIPSWVKRITVMLNGVSTNGASIPQIQLGAGSVDTTGYNATASSSPT